MNQRLKDLIHELKEQRKIYSQADFAEIVGISKTQFSEMVTGKRKISERTIHKIVSSLPEINENWLLTGEGNMLKDEASSSNYSPAIAENHSTAVSGYKNVVNSDPTIMMLLEEIAAQRKLTENSQKALLTAQAQITELIKKLK